MGLPLSPLAPLAKINRRAVAYTGKRELRSRQFGTMCLSGKQNS